MRILILSSFLITSFVVLIGVGTADAQTERRLSSTPKAFQTFYAKFRTAVIKRDRNAVVALTNFPFRYGWDAGDEGTYTRSQFIAKFNDIFGGTRKFFGQANPTFHFDAGSFNLTNEEDASHYVFEKRGSNYKFTAFVVEP
ncbi:MAG: hypothetical protein ABIU09_03360 [Pyrinomonadaceae bacterium]